jgi:TonB family protein
MFDRLIESDSTDLKPRRRYFFVSSVVVGLLFISAVIFSIYAADIGLGNDFYEVSDLILPSEMAQPQPEQQHQQQSDSQTADRFMRTDNIARFDESLRELPDISANPNAAVSRPNQEFQIGRYNIDRGATAGTDIGMNAAPGPTKTGTGSAAAEPDSPTEKPETESEPPKPVRLRSLGVVNGIAMTLPKPAYPAAAVSMNIQGKVSVQITIDEYGKVVSAKAVDGNPMLRSVSEKAALGARFKPTTLSNVPVKVTGVIVYNFTRN